MSLQLVANHLAQKGRGPDSTLVHMSNREVAGLQALAKKHGGQLSVNPDTGLPEAGFLDNILPMVAGAGLTAFTGIDPMTSAAIIGGITALDSKDLSKGLVAGLGAYGGGSLANGLLDSGISTLTQQGIADAGGAAALGPEGASAIAGDVAGQSTLAKLGAGAMSPGQTLATMGGGSMMRGGLPILAGLAPAITEAFDEEDEDKPPEQHKGYIRKYALDPVTGQYKQVGAYEAGGDPNVDVTAKAGTAGSYGGVGQSEYEAAQGMAAGGTATDSERIYDYLMGRGPNPMQFTHTQRPQVDYNINKPDVPITPTTPILEEVYDPYGNIQRGGMDAEGRAEQQAETAKRMDAWQASDPEGYAKRNDWIGNLFDSSTLGIAGKLIGKGVNAVQTYYRENQLKDIYAKEAAAAEAARLQSESNNLLGMIGYTNSFTPYSPPIGDPAQQAAIRNAINNTVFSGMDRGSTPNEPKGSGAAPTDGGAPPSGTASGANAFPGGSGIPPSGVGPQQVGDVSSRSVSGVSLDGGGEQRGSGPAAAPTDGRGPPSGERSGGEGRNGPEGRGDPGGDRGGWGRGGGYAHGGIANLHQYNLGSYSDGGRLLKGPGDGVSDSIPATIGRGQPARLADGEFVIPARIVSELGNGSTDAGARELYKMMDRIQAGRKKTVGKDQVAKNSKSARHLPA